MQKRWLAWLVLTFVIAAQGCTGLTGTPRDVVAPLQYTPETVMGMLDKHLVQLNRNIEGLTDRMADLQHMPDTLDPTIRELRALDLAGWQLHQEQWLLQRGHLQYARAQLQRAAENPSEKPQILQEWTKHEQEFEDALDDFRQQRHALEKKRLQVEAQLIDRHLR
jgi:prefoldin subunit 5